jgi:hypothetical protein
VVDSSSPSPGPTRSVPEEWHALRFRLGMLMVFLASAAIDLIFLALWIVVHQLVDGWVNKLGELQTLDAFTVNVIRVFFTISTLTVIGSYTIWDLIHTVRRIWSLR